MHTIRTKYFQFMTNMGILVSQTLARPSVEFSNLWHTSPHLPAFQWALGALSSGVKELWSEVNHSSSSSETLRMSGAVTPFPIMPSLYATLLYHILHIQRMMTSLPFINSTRWASGGSRATIFNVLWNEVITPPLAISGTL